MKFTFSSPGLSVPSAGTPVKLKDIVRAICFSRTDRPFEDTLREFLRVRYCFFVNSGTTALYLILKSLQRFSGKTKVVLPAYTAPSLILPIKKAGLGYKLVDISPDDFNMDKEKLMGAIDEDTLAVMPVHMFGLPFEISGLDIFLKNRNFYLIEDAASSFGTFNSHVGQYVGTCADIGFYSFNRGKNFSTTSGGLIVTNNHELSAGLSQEVKSLPELDVQGKIKLVIKTFGLSLAVRPWFYTLFKPFISRYKYTSLHHDFDSFQYTGFQKGLGESLFDNVGWIFEQREENGLFLREGLQNIPGLRLPVLAEQWRVVFNQFPFLVEDESKRDRVLESILKIGIEATTLYDKPIHMVYNDLKFKDDPFPKATYLSKRLILIPTHPLVPRKRLQETVKVIRENIR